jgi:hypothetical protein
MDIIYIGIVIAFFALTWGLMKACDILGEQQSGDRP